MTVRVIPGIIKETARKLRQDMTEVEVILWEKLRDRRLS
jgi:very-short-patch-repair endonuclease